MIKNILFDLDGTIINSQEGVTKCVAHVLKEWGMEQPPLESLRCFIGPPLQESFVKHFGFDEEKTAAAIVKYRERYNTIGIFECEVYDGVRELIQELHAKGYKLYLASSKPEASCKRIMEHFELDTYFDGIYGASFDGKICTKEEVLEYLFGEMQLERSESILIGDTRFDALGAKDAGISCIGVTYGFGTEEELKEAGVVAIYDTAKEVGGYFEEN